MLASIPNLLLNPLQDLCRVVPFNASLGQSTISFSKSLRLLYMLLRMRSTQRTAQEGWTRSPECNCMLQEHLPLYDLLYFPFSGEGAFLFLFWPENLPALTWTIHDCPTVCSHPESSRGWTKSHSGWAHTLEKSSLMTGGFLSPC